MRTTWLVVALLMPVALLNYLDRQMLAASVSIVLVLLIRPQPDGAI